jgi:hypothetical protein
MSKFRGFYLLGTLVILSLFVPPIVFAQQSPLDITISPIYLEYNAKPGEVIKDKIRVKNNSQNKINLAVDINKLAPSDTGEIVLEDKKPEDLFLNWVKFDANTVSVNPKEWAEVGFTLTIPDDAAFGYYMAISVSDSSKPGGNNTAVVSGAAAVPLLLNVKKEGAKSEAKLLNFESSYFINEELPVEFKAKISNTGNVHIRPRGNIFISGWGIKDRAVLDINSKQGSILPQATRSFDSLWDDGFLVKEPVMEDQNTVKLGEDGKPQTHLVIHWDKLTSFRIGPYKANLVMVFDDGKKDVLIEGSTTFWVLPYKLIIGFIASFLIILFIIKKVIDSYIKSELRKRNR